MLSATYTVSDVKSRLVNTYDYFGYTSDAAFESAIETTAQDVMWLYFYPRIGDTEYDRIAAKDRSSLTNYETYLYWAEVYTICYEILRWVESIQSQLQTADSESLSVEGYSYSTKTSSGQSQRSTLSLRSYFDKMVSYWSMAGFNLNALQRTCTIWGDSDANDIDRTIIE